MAAAVKTEAQTAETRLRHEEFCLPREDSDAPRIESYPYFEDDLATGRSRPVAKVTRCIECGATTYDRKES